MRALELTALITALANSIACGASEGEIALLAGFFVQLGDTLATIAAQRTLCEERAEENNPR